MNKYYLKITGRGYLKDITQKYHNGYFSKKLSFAKPFEDEHEAIDFRNEAITRLYDKINNNMVYNNPYYKTALELIAKAKIVSLENNNVEFNFDKARDVSMVKSRSTITSPSQKIYCVSCGVWIPGSAYVEIPRKNGYSKDHICLFCVQRLSEESESLFANIPDETKKAYKKQKFLQKL